MVSNNVGQIVLTHTEILNLVCHASMKNTAYTQGDKERQVRRMINILELPEINTWEKPWKNLCRRGTVQIDSTIGKGSFHST